MSNNTIKTRGFTLIELLVVIAIIGILSSVVLASLSTARAKSRDARRIADIDQLRTALEVYYDSNSNYATSSTGLQSWNATVPTVGVALITPSSIAKIPASPSATGSYYYCPKTVASSTTCDGTAATAGAYVIGADLERTDNNALKTDADVTVGSVFYGTSGTNCAANGAGQELCYDITN